MINIIYIEFLLPPPLPPIALCVVLIWVSTPRIAQSKRPCHCQAPRPCPLQRPNLPPVLHQHTSHYPLMHFCASVAHITLNLSSVSHKLQQGPEQLERKILDMEFESGVTQVSQQKTEALVRLIIANDRERALRALLK